jgi:hypothetical protein
MSLNSTGIVDKTKGGLAIEAMQHWSQRPLQSLIKNVKCWTHFGGLLIPVCLWLKLSRLLVFRRTWPSRKKSTVFDCKTWLNKKINKPMARSSLREVSQFVDWGLTMYVSKSMIFSTPHIGHSRHGDMDCQSKPSEKDHYFPKIWTRELWSSIPNHYTI